MIDALRGGKSSMNLTEYRQHVRTLAMRRDGQPVFNATVEHASIVIQHLFSSAERSIDILTGTLNPRVYGRDPVIKEAQLFMLTSPDSRIRIILEEDSSDIRMRHPLLVALGEFKNVAVKFADQGVRSRYGFHFMVTDNDNYRFESDKERPAAIASFGHTEGSKNLRDAYSVLWEQCTELSRPVADSSANVAVT